MIISNHAREADAVDAFPKPVATPDPIHPDDIKHLSDSRQPDAPQIAVIDQGQHAAWVSAVAERASLSSNKNVKHLSSNLDWKDVVSKLEAIADNPGKVKVINCSFGTSVTSKFERLFAADKADFVKTFGSNPARWTPAQKEAVKTRVNNLLIEAKSIVDRDKTAVSARLDQVFQRLHDKGISVVVAAGNNGRVEGFLKLAGVKPPAYLYDNLLINQKTSPNLIVVGATTTNDRSARPADFTSRNRFVDVAADGTSIKLGHGTSVSGTSFSAPQVAGLVADLYAKHPKLTPDAISNILKSSTLPGTAQAGKTGAGVVNRARAMQLAQAF